MPRTLPWAAQAVKKQEAKETSSSSSPAPRRKRASTPDDLVDDELNTTGVVTPERRAKRRPGRTPSTSPPPGPPDVEYMREGYAADDIWTMVEDEFYSTAQMFTQHIHHAEYVRLKKLAKSRGAGTLQAIARPTDGRTAQSDATKLKLEAEANARKIKAGIKEIVKHEESDEENDEYMQDPQLAGLMQGSQRAGPELAGLAKAKSKTRAAAGFSKSPQKSRRTRNAEAVASTSERKPTAKESQRKPLEQDRSEDEDEDLDAPATKSARALPPRPHSRERHMNGVSSSPSDSSSGISRRFQTSPPGARRDKVAKAGPRRHISPAAQEARMSTRAKSPPSSSESDNQAKTARSQATSDFLAKRKAAREKKEQTEKRNAKTAYSDVPIPTFAM